MSKVSYVNCPTCMKFFKFFKEESNNESINLKCPNCNQRFSISSKPDDPKVAGFDLSIFSTFNDDGEPHTAPVESSPVVDAVIEESSESSSTDESEPKEDEEK